MNDDNNNNRIQRNAIKVSVGLCMQIKLCRFAPLANALNYYTAHLFVPRVIEISF